MTEAMIATVVLSMAAAGVMLPFTAGAAAQNQGMRKTLAANLAGGLMEVILAVPFEEIVGSYNGYSESEGQISDFADGVLAGSDYAGLTRDASCSYVYTAQESGTGTPKFILVTVRVYYKGEQIAIVNRLITK